MLNKENVLKNLSFCTRCRQCRMVSERPLPEILLPICPSGDYFKFDSYFASGRITLAKKVLSGEIGLDNSLLSLIYSCTLCGSCKQQCPIDELEPVWATMALRQMAVAEGLADDYYPHFKEKYLAGSIKKDSESSTAFFIGCETQSEQGTVDAIITLLQNLGLAFQTLDNICCGAYLLRKGDGQSFKEKMSSNSEQIVAKGIKQIITHDPLCYKVLKENYKLEEKGVEVVFYLELLEDKLSEQTFNTGTQPLKVAYHDPCQFRTYPRLQDSARKIIGAINGVELIELERSRENAYCCGGAPDWAQMYTAASEAASVERLQEVETAGADMLVSTCHNCVTQLKKAAQRSNSKLQVENLTTLLKNS